MAEDIEASSLRPSKRQRLDTGLAHTNQSVAEGARSKLKADSSPGHLRIFSWNINGIAPFLQPSLSSFFQSRVSDTKDAASPAAHPACLRSFLRRHDWPQVLNLQEVKIRPDDEATKRRLQHAINQRRGDPDGGPGYTAHFCLPRDRYNAIGFGRKVYGVVTIVRDDFLRDEVDAVRQVDWDLEGRVLVLETKSKLSIWNLYCVNGTTSPYKHPTSGKVVGTRHDRKLAFHLLLTDECCRLQKLGWRIILTGDFNVAPEPIDGYPKLREFPEQHVKNRADFKSKFFDQARMVDAFRHLYPTTRAYSWISTSREWLSSCDRVDLFLVSRQLVEQEHALRDCNVLMTKADRGPSDHVPISITLGQGSWRCESGSVQGSNQAAEPHLSSKKD